MDCASFAQHAGFLRQLEEDVFSMQVREITMCYHSQTFPGDQLCVSVWQDEEDRETLHFQVHKGSESVMSSTYASIPTSHVSRQNSDVSVPTELRIGHQLYREWNIQLTRPAWLILYG